MRFIVAERTRQQKLKAAVCIKPTVEKQKEVDGASTCTGSTHPGIVHTVKMDVSTSVKIISIKITPRCAQRPIPQVTLDSVKFPMDTNHHSLPIDGVCYFRHLFLFCLETGSLSLGSSSWPGTYCAEQTGFQFCADPPASASQILRVQEHATTPAFSNIFIFSAFIVILQVFF